MTNEGELRARIADWVAVCRSHAQTVLSKHYIDEPAVEMADKLPIEFEGRSPELIRGFQQVISEQLIQSPADRVLRFAALFPLISGGLSNPFEPHSDDAEVVAGFRHLAGLCLPERLDTIDDLRFELYNSFLAANWELSDELFKRIALLDLLRPAELHLIRGHFWFLSVFGRRIEYELANDIGEYDFYWPLSLPSSDPVEPSGGWDQRFAREWSERRSFVRPELLASGSLAHWILAAWCCNPRAPKPTAFPPEPLTYTDPDEEAPDRTSRTPAEEITADSLRNYIHDRYRDFDTLIPPPVSGAQKQRLLRAINDLEQGCAASEALAAPYRPVLARSLFYLRNFGRAAAAYLRTRTDKVEFATSEGSSKEDFEWELWFQVALCRRLDGDRQGAIDTLAEFIESKKQTVAQSLSDLEPILHLLRPSGMSWWIAKWYSEQGNYHRAAEALRDELDSKTSPPETWQLSTILVLDEVVRRQESDAEAVRAYISSNSEMQLVLGSVVSQFWPTFMNLLQDSRVHWLSALWHSFADCPLPAVRPVWFRDAVKEYGWVVEHEMKARIFDPFRSTVQTDASLSKSAAADLRTYEQKFYRFLVMKSPEIEFGAMVAAVERCTASVVATDVTFRRFLELKFPSVAANLKALKAAAELRNRATHTDSGFSPETLNEMSRTCRIALDAICG